MECDKQCHFWAWQVDVISLPQDVLLLAYNDDTETFRSTLALASSVDGGHAWSQRAVLEADSRGSFHYPSILVLSSQVRMSRANSKGCALSFVA